MECPRWNHRRRENDFHLDLTLNLIIMKTNIQDILRKSIVLFRHKATVVLLFCASAIIFSSSCEGNSVKPDRKYSLALSCDITGDANATFDYYTLNALYVTSPLSVCVIEMNSDGKGLGDVITLSLRDTVIKAQTYEVGNDYGKMKIAYYHFINQDVTSSFEAVSGEILFTIASPDRIEGTFSAILISEDRMDTVALRNGKIVIK